MCVPTTKKTTMNQKVKISDLLPNPYRHLEHYKINEEKVSELVNSFKVSGYWPIIIARKNADGRYETAYGEHRKAAFRRLYGDNAEIEIIVRPLSEELMLKMMANENSDTWASSFINEMEAVKSAVEGFAAGKFTLPTVPDQRGVKLLYAPSFAGKTLSRDRAGKPYTAQTVAKFLGWTKPSGEAQEKVYGALHALGLLERGIVEIDQLVGLNLDKAQALLRETKFATRQADMEVDTLRDRLDWVEKEVEITKHPERKAKLEDEASEIKAKVRRAVSLPKKVAEQVSAKLKDKNIAARHAHETTEHILNRGQIRKLPTDKEFVGKLASQIINFLHPTLDKENTPKLNSVLENKAQIDTDGIDGLIRALETHIRVCKEWKDKLAQPIDNEKRTARKALPVN